MFLTGVQLLLSKATDVLRWPPRVFWLPLPPLERWYFLHSFLANVCFHRRVAFFFLVIRYSGKIARFHLPRRPVTQFTFWRKPREQQWYVFSISAKKQKRISFLLLLLFLLNSKEIECTIIVSCFRFLRCRLLGGLLFGKIIEVEVCNGVAITWFRSQNHRRKLMRLP